MGDEVLRAWRGVVDASVSMVDEVKWDREPRNMFKTQYHSALYECADRYRVMELEAKVPMADPLWRFTMEFRNGCIDGAPVPKLCRWLGYIQGVLIERGITDVETERDWTRPLFRPLDYPVS